MNLYTKLRAVASVLFTALAISALVQAPLNAQSSSAGNLPFVSPLFSDNMVLQRGQSDPIWGWTTPGGTVTVSATGKGFTRSATTQAGADGKWLARLPAPPTGGPYTVTISGPQNQSATLNNVLVGDVWICSGQSNMEFGVGNLTNPEPVIAAADYPQLRLFYVPHDIALRPAPTPKGTWQVCTPANLRSDGDWGGFSAVAYFFGRELYQDLHIPIGLIHTSYGGTVAEAWTSRQALMQKMPEFAPQIATLDEAANSSVAPEPMPQQMAKWYARNDPGTSKTSFWADPAMDDSAWSTMTLPVAWQDSGIPEMRNLNGIVWFRKEIDLSSGVPPGGITLHFLADDNDTTWVNGTQVGATEGWDTPRAYQVPASLLHAGRNVLAIRDLDTGGSGGIYGAPATLYYDAGGQRIDLTGPWRYRIGMPLTKASNLPQPIQNNPNNPTVLYNGMVDPLAPYGIKGAIWYQGESNAGRAYQYRALLPTMIGDWRARWNQGNFPFLIVQLAGYGTAPAQPGDDAWAELREAQWLTAQNTPNTGIATAVDIGNSTDIHPKNKQEVGRRLALVARKQVYHEKVESSGPVYKSMKIEGSAIRLTFDHAAGGLAAKDSAPLTGFAVAGEDGKWSWADARIDGDTVIVSSSSVPKPLAVRYSWAGYLPGNLYNQAGLPAFPFRTDDLPLSTEPH